MRLIIVFFALTLSISGGIVALAWALGTEDLAAFAILVPTTTALILTAQTDGRAAALRLLRLRTGGRATPGWVAFAALIFPVLALAAIALSRLIESSWPEADNLGGPLAIIPLGVISFGEELGWRGFALSRLLNFYNPLVSGLIMGAVWALWHGPAALLGVGVPLDTPFWLFALWVIAASLIMTVVFVSTRGSLWLMVLMHSMANASFVFLPLLPENSGRLTGFAVFVALAALVATVAISRTSTPRSTEATTNTQAGLQ